MPKSTLRKHNKKLQTKNQSIKERRLVIRRIKAKSGADAVAKDFGESKQYRTRMMPNKKKDYKKPSWE